MAEAYVVAHDLSRTYRVGAQTVHAVEHATCTIRPRARIALQGRSGSGKSTLLQMLAGIEEPSGGTLAWPALGARETLRPASIAVVFQRESLLAPLTVIENVALPLVLAGVPDAVARTAAERALARFELGTLRDKLPEELSGGQAQRVAFVRAIAQRPRLLLADEPTGQLDSDTAGRFLALVFASLAETDTALVVATHDANVAARLSDRWQMERGRLEAAT
ncbi:MAG: ATP-binding cassette domain-containing protein [Vulcanimicrobiaceae bacterium]